MMSKRQIWNLNSGLSDFKDCAGRNPWGAYTEDSICAGTAAEAHLLQKEGPDGFGGKRLETWQGITHEKESGAVWAGNTPSAGRLGPSHSLRRALKATRRTWGLIL